MYKLVAIAGKIRGEEFELTDGENTLGRDSSSSICIDVAGISRKHLTITVVDGTCYLADEGSNNGTFINGKLFKRGSIKQGDKITLPHVILKLVKIKQKKKIIKRRIQAEEEPTGYMREESMPESIPGKFLHIFKYKLMPIFHGVNQEYEWRVLIGILLSIFIIVTVALTIFPVLQDNRRILIHETSLRGETYAKQIARTNARALESKNLERVDTTFLENEEGVSSYVLFDLEGRIVRPITKLNEYIKDPFSVSAKNIFSNNEANQTIKRLLDDGEIGIARKITAYNARVGSFEPVGIIAIRFTPRSLAIEAVKNSRAYLESLSTSALIAIFFFGIVYYLTLRPIEELRYQVEEALAGKRKEIESELLMDELGPLKSTLNSMIVKVRESQNEGGDDEFYEMETDDTYLETLKEFLKGAGSAAIVLNSNKELKGMNLEAEDLLGFRESGSLDQGIIDIAREKGIAATVIEACDDCANASGMHQEGHYELSGSEYRICASGLVGKDGFAKGFLVTFLKDD